MTAYPLAPPLDCDIIMKGGITSGVIYPHAVCELARTYRLRSVGGASAGAIAAAAAAAAEVGRAAGGFDRLERLPDDLTAASAAGGSLLFRLFQPQASTAPLFRALAAGLDRKGIGRVLRPFGVLLIGFVWWVVAGALPGAAVIAVGVSGMGSAPWVTVFAEVLLFVLGAAVGVLLGLALRLRRAVPANGYGLCSGMPGARPHGAPALTPWLHDTLQALAGRPDGASPLTFDDLTSAGVELQVMTTNLTRRQPMAMPWAEREYFFDPQQFSQLFPEVVVRWMEDHPPDLAGGPADQWRSELRRRQALPLRPFPAPEDVPIVVATRMSLSFPLLISAVPLYSVDYYTSRENQDARAAADEWRVRHPAGTLEEALAVLPRRTFGVNWFSDGGICSNLPVHLFDQSLPTRPTFAIDLARFTPRHPKCPSEFDNSYMPEVNQAGLLRRWTYWQPSGLGALAGFGRSIIETARCWVDESQLVMPGYRDRIVTIFHDDKEGGMNLAMPRDVVTKLAERGRGGASRLVERFAGVQPGVVPASGWENQRWIRFRTATAGLHRWLAGFRDGYEHRSPGETPYAELAGPGATAPLPSYVLTGHRREVVNQHTGQLLALVAQWENPPVDGFTHRAPSPGPQLRLTPGDGAK